MPDTVTMEQQLRAAIEDLEVFVDVAINGDFYCNRTVFLTRDSAVAVQIGVKGVEETFKLSPAQLVEAYGSYVKWRRLTQTVGLWGDAVLHYNE